MDDFDAIVAIYDQARAYMADEGNYTQWGFGYPDSDIVRSDVESSNSYVIVADDEIVGTFYFSVEDDPTYRVIEGGVWGGDSPYGVIHRLASSGKARGVGRACFEFCAEKIGYLRIDTHHNNQSMRKALTEFGFVERGIIYTHDGTPRLAFDYSSK